MRLAFIKTLTELAQNHDRIVLLTGDLGYGVVDVFVKSLPDRFYNIGVAEQNMIGIATGLAEAGLIPFTYSIATFATLRPYEFIRNGPVMHSFPVRIIGVGGGLEYGSLGATHHGLEDVGIMRIQPGLTVIAPSDAQQARSALLATWDLPGPIYYRLGKDEDALIPGLNGHFDIGHVSIVRSGQDVLLITTGSIASEVVAAADSLHAKAIESTVAIVPCLNPAPVTDLADLLAHSRVAFTIEAHYLTGGLGSLAAEIVADHGLNSRIIRCGIKNQGNGITGSQAYLHRLHGLDNESLANLVCQTLRV